MATTVVSMATEKANNTTRYFYRATVSDGDTVKIKNIPAERFICVSVYPDSATTTVKATNSSEASIDAATENSVAWPSGQVTVDTSAVLYPGYTGVVITTTNGDTDIDVTA